MSPSSRRFVENVRGILAERRNLSRLPCDIAMYDREGRMHRIANIGLAGIRYLAPVAPPEEAHRFSLPLPQREGELSLLVRPAWVRERTGFGWDVGASVTCEGDDLRRWHFIVNSLKENREFADLRFIPFEILDAPLDPPDLIERIAAHPLTGSALTAAQTSGAMFGRPPFYWKWADDAIRRTTLSSVHPGWYEAAVSLKLCAAVFFTAVDDIADDLQDRRFYRQLMARVQRHRPHPGDREVGPERARQIQRLDALWRYLVIKARGLPRYREVVDCLRFDVATILHAMSHSLVVNHSPSAICESEQQFWGVNAFYVMVFTDFDLMCSPDLALDEIGTLREIAIEAQHMCAIANWIGTWEREIRSGDYSSAVIGAALQRNIVSTEDLSSRPDELIEAIRATDIETALMARWEKHWSAIDRRRRDVHCVDVDAYLAGLESFLKLHIAARRRLEEAPPRPAVGD